MKFLTKDLYTKLFDYDNFLDTLTSIFFNLNVANAKKESDFRKCLILDKLSNKDNDECSFIINMKQFAVG